MKLQVVVLALIAFLCANAQVSQVILCTYYDNSCVRIMECSVEPINTCNLGVYIGFNTNGTNIVSMYSGSVCSGTVTNTTYTANTCAPIGNSNSTSSASLTVFTSGSIWSTTSYYGAGSCSTPLLQSSFSANYSGASCTPTNCTCTTPYACTQTTCGLTTPTCLVGGNTILTQSYNFAGCPTTALTALSCEVYGQCINIPGTNTSLMATCTNNVIGGNSYNLPNCQNVTNAPAGNSTYGNCIPNGKGIYTSVSCSVTPSTSTGSTTGASTTTSNASVISFSVISVLSIVSMLLLSLLI